MPAVLNNPFSRGSLVVRDTSNRETYLRATPDGKLFVESDNTDNNLNTINSNVNIGNTKLESIDEKNTDLAFIRTATENTLSELKNNIDAKLTALNTSINDRLNTTNTELNSMNTKMTANNDSLTAIDTNTGNANSNLIIANNRLETIETNSNLTAIRLNAIKSELEDANTKLDTLINLAELEESSLTVRYIVNAGNTAVFIPDSAGVRLKSLNYGSSNASRGSVHLYDDISTATIDNINDDPKLSLFCPSNETAYKSSEGYVYFENGIWVRAVDVAEPKANNSDHTPNAVTLTWYKVV